MRELLSAGLQRYRKSFVFWVTLAMTLVLGIVTGFLTRLDGYIQLFYFAGLFLIIAIQISLMIGIEFSNGVVRNKLMVGHGKGTVFLSELLLSLISAGVHFAVFYGVFALFTADLFRSSDLWDMPVYLIGLLLVHLSLAVICTAICFFIPYNTALAAIFNIILVFGMIFICDDMKQKLYQPEFYYSNVRDENGGSQTIAVPNPEFIPHDSAKYVWLHTVYYLMPYGQLIDHGIAISYDMTSSIYLMNEENKDEMKSAPFLSFIEIGLFTAAGFVCFRKKELK